MKLTFKIKSFYKPLIIIINPGPLEIPTNRPGGIQEILLKISEAIKDKFHIIIFSPFLYRYVNRVQYNDILIEYIYYPAVRNYPLKSIFSIAFGFFRSLIFYSLIVSINLLKYKKNLRLLIISDKSNVILILVARLLKVKTIFSEGNPYPWYSPFSAKKPSVISWGVNLSFAKLACKLATKIRAQSILIKRGMISYGIPKEKIEIIPAGVDTNTFKPYNHIENNFLIGFFGRLTDEKGASLLYDIIKTCEKELPEAKFIIRGSGPYEIKLKNLKNVIFQETLPRNMLPIFINKASLFISTYYDFSLSDLEILSCGKPLIKINTPEMNGLFKNYEEIIFCDKNVKDFVNKIKLLYENKELRKKIGENARKKVEKEFDWKVIGEQWIRLINSLLK
ncbi:MAG: glycosyltransferase family 4 protein [Thermoproteota archaeon]|jgi:glycosyltransferase involved in cell wall biosynthesis|nr:glycosyltransferase family 4 protein [Thermoproteota archaeon]